MKLAETRDDGLRAEAEPSGSSRMPSGAGVRQDLEVGDRGTGGFKERQSFGLGIERIEALRLARLPLARAPFAGEQQRESRVLGIAEIAPAQLEQAHRRCSAIEVAAGGGNQARQERRAHYLHL